MKRNPLILASCILFVLISTILYLLVPVRVLHNEKPTVTPTPQSPVSHVKTYTNQAQGFSLSYPDGMKVDEAYKYDNLQSGKSIPGVSFAFAPTFSQGTNLSSDSHVAVEWKNTQLCEPKEFTDEPQGVITLSTVNGKEWSVASTSGVGAGNLYEEVLYVRKGVASCFNIRLFLHSSNIGNYTPGMVRAFDRNSIDTIYTDMLSSFVERATTTTL